MDGGPLMFPFFSEPELVHEALTLLAEAEVEARRKLRSALEIAQFSDNASANVSPYMRQLEQIRLLKEEWKRIGQELSTQHPTKKEE